MRTGLHELLQRARLRDSEFGLRKAILQDSVEFFPECHFHLGDVLRRGRALDADPEERLALQFRIEKKKLLREVIDQLL